MPENQFDPFDPFKRKSVQRNSSPNFYKKISSLSSRLMPETTEEQTDPATQNFPKLYKLNTQPDNHISYNYPTNSPTPIRDTHTINENRIDSLNTSDHKTDSIQEKHSYGVIAEDSDEDLGFDFETDCLKLLAPKPKKPKIYSSRISEHTKIQKVEQTDPYKGKK